MSKRKPTAKKISKVMQKGVTRLEFERDPYCSTECCKRDHGLLDRPLGEKCGFAA